MRRDAEVPEGRTPITFDVKVAFDVVVSEYSFAEMFGTSPIVPLSEPVDLRERRVFSFPPRAIEREATVERSITVEATVVEEEEGEYRDLRIEKILTY